jgi:uncharacterized membrane protein
MIPAAQVACAAGAAVIGMLADSYLGATLQRAGKLNNSGVNATSTAFAAALGLVCGQKIF